MRENRYTHVYRLNPFKRVENEGAKNEKTFWRQKVETNGETTLHQRYLYRGYLQIAACNLATAARDLDIWELNDAGEPDVSGSLYKCGCADHRASYQPSI